MKKQGPNIAHLTHRLADCPAELYLAPIQSEGKRKNAEAICLQAVIADHLRDIGVESPEVQVLATQLTRLRAEHTRLIAITIWLLRDEWLIKLPDLISLTPNLLTVGIEDLSEAIKPETTVTDPDRREELARVCLELLGYRPEGETINQARDRLNTLDSAERVRVIKRTRAAEVRARKIREAMARKAAQEAATRYSPE